MADTVTTTLGLTKPEVGASEDSWGEKINTNFDLVDDALDGTTAVSLDINGGTIDGAVIGGATPAAITGTAITGTSFATSGDFTFGDNDKAIFGAGSDLQIYHNTTGFTGNIIESATNNLYIRSNSLYFQKADGTENNMFAISDGAVSLAYDNAVKLATTSTGIDVTGTVTADGLTVSSDVTFTDASPNIYLIETDTTDLNTALGGNAGVFKVLTRNDSNINVGTRLAIDHASGDISFYEDTGTTAKFFWDASDQELEITSTGVHGLHLRQQDDNTANSSRLFFDNATNIWTAYSTNGYFKLASNATIGTSSGTDRFVIDSSGRVMIGTTTEGQNQADNLTISDAGNMGMTLRSTNSGETSIFFSDGTSGAAEYAGWLQYVHASDYMTFGTDATERMRIDSSGNLIMKASSDTGNRIQVNGADETSEILEIGITSGHAQLTASHASGGSNTCGFIFRTRGGGSTSERMRIDSSGNLLVGKTSSSASTTGAELQKGSGGQSALIATAAGTKVGIINRTTSDGDIIEFRKDNTTVGSIGTYSSDFYIGNPDEALIRFGNEQVVPANNTGADRDNAIDLGGTGGRRFRDLFLSGGVYLGGTGSANKLDDYEEGTFTPTLAYSSNGTLSVGYNAQDGYYTKIGRLVHFKIELRLATFTKGTASGNLLISGLPFTSNNINARGGHEHVSVQLYNAPITQTDGNFPVAQVFSNSTQLALFNMRNNNSFENMADPTGAAQYKISGTYFTN